MVGFNRRTKAPRRRTLKHIKHINWVAIIVAVSVTCFAWTAWVALQHRTNQANLTKKLNEQSQQLDKKIDEATKANKSVEELQKQKADLEKQLQAKRARATAYAATAPQTRIQAPRASRPVGTHADWMTAAGIPADQQAAAEVLVQRESSWNPLAYNGSSGSCSLVQALPCSKIPGDWRDPITALRWGHSYVVARYGTWQVALNHSNLYNWY